MRPTFPSLTFAAFVLVACVAETPQPLLTPAPEGTVSAINTQSPLTLSTDRPPQRVPVLRVAILGDVTTTNVWSLFDEPGASYWNAATQSSYWPSLYYLAPPFLDLQPATAQGDIPPILCDNLTCTATVSLRPGLAWTDGSPFTAADVVFTINTALEFQLGLNWRQFYNPGILDHAEAMDERTVKLYFKSHPTVADWQYGVLQGPIVNRAYWQPRIADAIYLLPHEELLSTIQELEGELAWMQMQLNETNLILSTGIPSSKTYQDASRQADRLQDDIIGTENSLEKKYAEYETILVESRAALFALDNSDEPTFGPWKFSSRNPGRFENRVNFGTPFGDPWFDSVRYSVYRDEKAAVEALVTNEVDLILSPNGLSSDSVFLLEQDPDISLSRNVTRSARFLGFNLANPYLADPVLRQALVCAIDPAVLIENLGDEAAPLSGFVLDGSWRNKDASLPCAGLTGDARTVETIRLLKEALYFWDQEPTYDRSGSGLKAPDGTAFPPMRLLASQQDPLRSIAAQSIQNRLSALGFEIVVELRSPDDLLYAVYGSRDFDLALLGWRLSAYPDYLCNWFTPWGQNPFVYSGSSLRSACEAWGQVNDLGLARSYAFEVQSILAQDLPLIPLYANVRVDPYRNVYYPFNEVIDGLGGLYGAPGLANPVPLFR